jgi:ATP-dependent Clp protease ATP-binding subunit ClpA
MFERFTQGAKAVLVAAQDVAVELGTGHIGPGHILYGCAAGREPTAGEVLRACGITEASIRRLLPRSEDAPGDETDPEALHGIDLEALHAIGIDYEGVRAVADETFGTGALESAPDRRVATAKLRKPPFTPEAKRSLALALRAATELDDRHMEPGHLLLGLLRLNDDFISSIVQQSGSTVTELSASVLERLVTA